MEKGVAFRCDCQICALVRNGNRIDGVSCGWGHIHRHAKDVVSISVYPLKECSLTIPLADEMAELPVSYRAAVETPADPETVVCDLFPTGGHIAQAMFWTDLRR
ncbi:MAG: D-amino acid dehydrogenase [Sodalis sp.]|nr:MAG: D-amino acid dehydrogenase [Sodalis sp.]